MKRPKQLFKVRWRARGAVGFKGDRSVSTMFFSASPSPAVCHAPCRPDLPVVCPGFGIDRLTWYWWITCRFQNMGFPQAVRVEAKSGGAGLGSTGRQQNCSSREQASIVFPKHQKHDISTSPQDKRTCKSLNRRNEIAVDNRFVNWTRSALSSWLPISVPSPICLWQPFMQGMSRTRSALRSWLLTSGPTLFLSLWTLFMQGMSKNFVCTVNVQATYYWCIQRHALHKKRYRSQKKVVPLVGSQKQRKLLVLLIHCG